MKLKEKSPTLPAELERKEAEMPFFHLQIIPFEPWLRYHLVVMYLKVSKIWVQKPSKIKIDEIVASKIQLVPAFKDVMKSKMNFFR